MTSNVNINISAPQFSKKSKRRTFSTAYKKYVCMRIRNGQERVIDVAKEEELSDAYVYKLLHIYDTTGFEPQTETNSAEPLNTNVTVAPQETVDLRAIQLMEHLAKQVQELTHNFQQFKQNLAALTA
jgi:transposase-like protein